MTTDTPVRTVRVSSPNAARWRLDNTALRASLMYQAHNVATRYGAAVVLVDEDTGEELYRAEPVAVPRGW